ncbi:peptidoglycan editing factor PgeF [Patulibacter sp.]|uniref:peptidoglycan editing factor PgeF n=1 Tax=Patulibacter sp. TaxID=1912859 RepID=UPI00271DFB9C|nr:peptidoglycan editing factor PgeF [Patulibacter sp.]MDO9410534.1 peptidoglycan editing factor PgeF [Patulibacter sp.]
MPGPTRNEPFAAVLRDVPDGGLACELPGARVHFTGRRGGVSAGAFSSLNLGSWTTDDPDHVRANRDRLAALAATRRDRLAQPHQVHGTDVLVVRGDDDLPGPDLERVRDADGVATALPGVPCVVLCADCLPVALVADGAVAMVHAGWRGLVGGVLEEGVRGLRAAGGRGAVTAVVGPGAGPCCYEVGDEVHDALAPLGPTVRAGRNADLPEAARLRLLAAGVDRVVVAGICTICAPERFFSHRRDAGNTGRQAGAAWLT